MNIIYYQDDYFYYFRKPNGMASTFGKQKSYLDCFEEILNGQVQINHDLITIIKNQNQAFGQENEYGLLNRLDNDTGGLLYFAKNSLAFDNFKKLQKKGLINKIYIADVISNFKYDQIEIDKTICHHRHNSQKMIIYNGEEDLDKVRGIRHQVSTFVTKLFFDHGNRSSCLEIIINKGVRHQIRLHLASIGYPIIGEKLYTKSPKLKDDFLHLWSVGMTIDG